MDDAYQLLITNIRGVWHRRWYVIAVAWLICGAGWTVVAVMPNKYETSARIYVDVDTMLGPLMKGLAVEMNVFQQIDIIQRTLLSRPNLEKILLLTDLDLTVNDPMDKEKLFEELVEKIKIRQQGRNLFQISYVGTDRALAKRVVQSVMQIFVEGNLGASRKDMDTTRRFLRGQIRDYERQLNDAEQRLAHFKRRNMGFLGRSNNYFQQMETMRGRLTETEAAIGEATSVLNELASTLKSVPQFLEVYDDEQLTGGLGTGPESQLQIRIFDLEQVMDSLLTRYTEKHPDVVATKKRLEALRKQQREELAADDAAMEEAEKESASGSETPTQTKKIPNPVYDQVKLQLIQQQGIVAALKNRAEQARKEVKKWNGLAQTVPKVEAELVRLDRDYGIVKKAYEELRSRQESAKLARELETKAQKVEFRIVDPPKIPLKPISPNRPLFHSLVLLIGIAGGIAFSFVLNQIKPTFATIRRLRATFTLPVLGKVSATQSALTRRRMVRELMSFGLVSMALLIAFAGFVSVEFWGAVNVMNMFKELVVL